MPDYTYLIIGGGMTAAEAIKGIREVDLQGSIGIISAENHRPYNRPPLTKKLWFGKPEEIIWRDLPQDNLTFHLGQRVTQLDPVQKKVVDQSGTVYHYQRLLLATGGSPRKLPFGSEEVLYYRTLDDYHTVRGWTGKGARIGVIGGGFIGSEIAAALAGIGEKVIMAFPDQSIGSRIYPADLSQFLTQYFNEKGIETHTGMTIEGIERQGDQLMMKGQDGTVIQVDHIIAGIGIQPNTELAQAAGIEIAGKDVGSGIQVDAYLRTSQPDIFAAGDVASFYNEALQRQMRVEHEDNAVTMGRIAGLNMAGQAIPYQHQPYFYSDLFELGYEAVGELDARLDIDEDWREPFHQGVVYYLKDQKVRGVLLWNTWGQVDAARQMIAEGQAYERSALKSRLPEP